MKYLLLIIAITLLITGCSAPKTDNADAVKTVVEYKKISPETAKEMMEEQGTLVIDVRTPDEYAQTHIPGAKLVPLDDISNGKLGEIPDKDQILLVYCRSGNRSGQAARKLIDLGYTNVYDFGGIVDWPYDTKAGMQE